MYVNSHRETADPKQLTFLKIVLKFRNTLQPIHLKQNLLDKTFMRKVKPILNLETFMNINQLLYMNHVKNDSLTRFIFCLSKT